MKLKLSASQDVVFDSLALLFVFHIHEATFFFSGGFLQLSVDELKPVGWLKAVS